MQIQETFNKITTIQPPDSHSKLFHYSSIFFYSLETHIHFVVFNSNFIEIKTFINAAEGCVVTAQNMNGQLDKDIPDKN